MRAVLVPPQRSCTKLEDNHHASIVVDGKDIELDIYFPAGQEEFYDSDWILESEAFILVYAIDDKASFDNVSRFRKQIVKQIVQAKDSDDVSMVLVANKPFSDSEQKVTAEEGRALAKEFNIPFFETLRFDYKSITAPFQQAARCIQKSRPKYPTSHPTSHPTRRRGRCLII
mmetsp:Transcript_40161/g.67262  ORF Transcript_40161/g.67262 Transcript_40161/m.67262 type:complete len:172 (-) Transcript_40161:102-617(-)